jgi:hypothetical protein
MWVQQNIRLESIEQLQILWINTIAHKHQTTQGSSQLTWNSGSSLRTALSKTTKSAAISCTLVV